MQAPPDADVSWEGRVRRDGMMFVLLRERRNHARTEAVTSAEAKGCRECSIALPLLRPFSVSCV